MFGSAECKANTERPDFASLDLLCLTRQWSFLLQYGLKGCLEATWDERFDCMSIAKPRCICSKPSPGTLHGR
eukprot:scaffold108738_cov20-Prasinocladus_malaysianus.AAC.1